MIEEVDNENIFIKEQEYIDLLNPTINTRKAFRTEEQKKEYDNENGKKYYEKNKNSINIKSNCPECGKEMFKNNINRHINNIHKLQSQSS